MISQEAFMMKQLLDQLSLTDLKHDRNNLNETDLIHSVNVDEENILIRRLNEIYIHY
jgi:hypothetical protein